MQLELDPSRFGTQEDDQFLSPNLAEISCIDHASKSLNHFTRLCGDLPLYYNDPSLQI